MSERPSAICAGYMPLDIILSANERARHRAGGTAANVAAILALLGWDSALTGRIGDDPAGREVIADLERSGVDTSLIERDPEALTPRLVHRIERDGHHYAYVCPDCGQRFARSRPLRLDQVADVAQALPSPTIYFFDRANPATVELAERYSRQGATVVFEPSVPANAELVQRAVAAAAIVKGSEEHGPALVLDMPDLRSKQLRVITRGVAGAEFRLGSSKWRHVGIYDVPLLDAAGAGDWTTAGMLHKLVPFTPMTESAVRDAIWFGHSLAALNCMLPGARGLADDRQRASVLGLATRLRRGEQICPHPRQLRPRRVPSGSCSTCLLVETASGELSADRSLARRA